MARQNHRMARPGMLLALVMAIALGDGLMARGQGPWSTYRGNPQRTGCADSMAGPTSMPSVLWTWQARDHFIASPVPSGERLLVSGLGAFNVSTVAALALAPTAEPRLAWTRSAPYLKLPTVSSPALAGDSLVFGDGMHQTDGAILYCLSQASGLPLWQLPVEGKLVHLEGGPTVVDGRVYLGGGAAGVLCVDMTRVTLEDREMSLEEIRKVLEQRWQQLLARYEEEKKKDPDFAVPPREDQLPRPRPRVVWQQGAGKWHVDAPIAVVGNRVLVGSSFLDREQVGDRALYCLDATTGKVLWRSALSLNPWGGPSVQGGLVVVGGSTIGYYPKELRGARGEVVALELATGKEVWHKEVQGGVVSCVALTADLAVATATDGKVRAFDLKTGLRRWIHDARTPFFAPPAIAGDTVYVGDLLGVLHALSLGSGQPRWRFELGKQLPQPAPGMFYAGPVLSGGRLYAATCNLEGPHVGKPTVVICLGAR